MSGVVRTEIARDSKGMLRAMRKNLLKGTHLSGDQPELDFWLSYYNKVDWLPYEDCCLC